MKKLIVAVLAAVILVPSAAAFASELDTRLVDKGDLGTVEDVVKDEKVMAEQECTPVIEALIAANEGTAASLQRALLNRTPARVKALLADVAARDETIVKILISHGKAITALANGAVEHRRRLSVALQRVDVIEHRVDAVEKSWQVLPSVFGGWDHKGLIGFGIGLESFSHASILNGKFDVRIAWDPSSPFVTLTGLAALKVQPIQQFAIYGGLTGGSNSAQGFSHRVTGYKVGGALGAEYFFEKYVSVDLRAFYMAGDEQNVTGGTLGLQLHL